MPTEPTYHNNLGLSNFESEEFETALGNYDEAIRLEKEKCDLDGARSRENLSFYYKNLGLAFYHQGDMVSALDAYEQAIRCNATNADNYFNRGNVRLNEENFELAHKDFETAIELENQNAKFYHAKGLAFQAEAELEVRHAEPDHEIEAEKINEAIYFFQRSLQFCSTFISSMFHLGLMYRRTEKFHEALQ